MKFISKKRCALLVVGSILISSILPHITFADSFDSMYVTEEMVKVTGSTFATESIIELPIKFDDRWLIEGDNTKLNKELANFAVLLSTDMYTDCCANLDADKTDKTKLLSSLGFSDVEHHNITSDTTGIDEDDRTSVVFANKLVNISEKIIG